jgi:hypothetical protein
MMSIEEQLINKETSRLPGDFNRGSTKKKKLQKYFFPNTFRNRQPSHAPLR